MNKTPIAAGLAMIMGISVVFAFDRVKPIEDATQNTSGMSSQTLVAEAGDNLEPGAGIEANILMEEAPLILKTTDSEPNIINGVNNEKLAGDEVAQADGHRSLKMALADMQYALERLEREAELTHRAVALLEQKYRQ